MYISTLKKNLVTNTTTPLTEFKKSLLVYKFRLMLFCTQNSFYSLTCWVLTNVYHNYDYYLAFTVEKNTITDSSKEKKRSKDYDVHWSHHLSLKQSLVVEKKKADDGAQFLYLNILLQNINDPLMHQSRFIVNLIRLGHNL